MKIRQGRKILLISAAAFCVLYVFIAVKQLGTELNFKPDWTESITDISRKNSGGEPVPFRLGQNLGYFTEDGQILSCIPFPSKASVSKDFYTIFSENNTDAKLYRPDGTVAGSLKFSGFPYICDDRIFVFLPGGSSFLRTDSEGRELWKYEYYAPVTAFSSSKGGTAAGFADGTIVSFTEEGNVDQKFTPGGSDYPVILGTAISEDGNTIACVSGQNKQRFVLAAKDGEHTKIIFHEYLDVNQTKQVMVKFNSEGSVVYYDAGEKLGIVNINKLKSSRINLKGSVVQIEELCIDENNVLTVVLSRKGKTYTVTILEPFDNQLGSFDFEADAAFLQVRNNALFVGRDDKISRITVERK